MRVRIERPRLSGEVRAVASKSHAHRLLICAALSDSNTFVGCAETSGDIEATASCLTALGADITRRDGGYYVKPVKPRGQGAAALDCGESGSTLRFLLPVALALGTDAAIKMRGRLSARPLSPLLEELISHGGEITGVGTDTLRCRGRLKNGKYTLPGDVSSQFISGLMFALPMLEDDSVIEITGDIESAPYIDMTLCALEAFGVNIGRGGGRFCVSGGQGYRSPGAVYAEGDWSNAAFWLCAGALGGPVTCAGLNMTSVQGDMAVARMLEQFGADVRYGEDSVTVSRRELTGTRIDARDTPDLVPALAAVASAARGETVISGAGRLRIKESDRLEAISDTLGILGANISEASDGMIIKGVGKLRGGAVSSHGDHRIAMAAAVASIVCEDGVVIGGAEAVGKSYPGFFDDFAALGGLIKEEL